jgi:hypothetical protein
MWTDVTNQAGAFLQRFVARGRAVRISFRLSLHCKRLYFCFVVPLGRRVQFKLHEPTYLINENEARYVAGMAGDTKRV